MFVACVALLSRLAGDARFSEMMKFLMPLDLAIRLRSISEEIEISS